MLDQEEHEKLRKQVVDEVCDQRSSLLFWGVSRLTLEFLADLRRLGLTSAIVGVVDHRIGRVGMMISDWIVLAPPEVAQLEFDCLVIGLDGEKEEALRQFVRYSRTTPRLLLYGAANYQFRDDRFEQLVHASLVKSHAGGYADMLVHLYQALRMIAARRLHGDVAEFGVYKAGTTTFLARCLTELRIDGVVYGLILSGVFLSDVVSLTLMPTQRTSTSTRQPFEPIARSIRILILSVAILPTLTISCAVIN